MLSYTAIDFETANYHRGSPCSLGMVKVRDGAPVDERHWLMRPPEGYDHFALFNVALHGITPTMVEHEPRWHDRLPAMLEFIDGDVVIAHNAAFDIGVVRDACSFGCIAWPSLDFLCTLVMSRRALALPSYRLPFVMDALGIPFHGHHDALADARAVTAVVGALAALGGTDDLDVLAEGLHVSFGQVRDCVYKGSQHKAGIGSNRGLVMPDLNSEVDPDGDLYGRVVVFTGTLTSMTRQMAWEACIRAGAIAEKDVTRRTNVLVVGMEFNLTPGVPLTNKAAYAATLRSKGLDIEIITEADFLRSLS